MEGGRERVAYQTLGLRESFWYVQCVVCYHRSSALCNWFGPVVTSVLYLAVAGSLPAFQRVLPVKEELLIATLMKAY